MDVLIAIALLWGSMTGAAENQAKADAAKDAQLLQMEASLLKEQADSVLSADWAVLPSEAYQGDAALVRSKEPATLSWNKKSIILTAFGKGYYAYLPIPVDMKPGAYSIGSATLTVKRKTFDTQRLTVSQEQEQMRYNTERINRDQAKIDKARSVSEPAFLSVKPFVVPVKGTLTTPYGFTRYVNGVFSGSHLAVDLAAPTGTPVKATNDGKVVLAEELYLTGNSIYIDHGMGLFSQYAHLSKLDVKTGDRVKAGGVIGEVGTTGFSTGPHLHFTFWVHGVQANPNLFFDTTPFQWNNKSNQKR